MTLDEKPTVRNKPGDRPFPWRCSKCLEKEVYPERTAYTARVAHDGRTYEIDIPGIDIPTCRNCTERVFSVSVDDQILQAMRAYLRLLAPQQIKKGREGLALSSAELAERLGVSEATVLAWEMGELIPARAMDNLLRVYFALPEVREVLCGVGQDPHLGASDRE